MKSGYRVGESIIDGVLCDHLPLRNEKLDVQVWIEKGHEPAPRRIVITTKNFKVSRAYGYNLPNGISRQNCLSVFSLPLHLRILSAVVFLRTCPQMNRYKQHHDVEVSNAVAELHCNCLNQ